MDANRVSVIGWYGHGNVGDESYKSAFPTIFSNLRLEFSDRLNKNQKTGHVILGGGNVCSSSFLNQVEKAEGKKIAFSIGVTKNDPIERMKMFDQIFVRDCQSQDFLNSEGIHSSVVPDAAFALVPDKNKGRDLLSSMFASQNREMYQKVVAVVFNAYLCVGEGRLARDEATFQKVTWDISKVIDTTSASFVFIPFGQSQPHDDRISNAWLASRCKFWKKNLLVMSETNPQTTLDLLSACDVVISTRLHSSIFSTVAGVPFIDVTHHSKNKTYLDVINRSHWSVSYWDFERSRFSNLINSHLVSKDSELVEIANNNRNKLAEMKNNVRLD